VGDDPEGERQGQGGVARAEFWTKTLKDAEVMPAQICDNRKFATISGSYMGKKPDEQLSDKEAEQRATDALRRALSTPYKPQSDLKIGKPKKRREKKPKEK
jgi:hypothetical protein